MPSQNPTPSPAPFIISTSLAKPDPATRKLIRSHVMRGKNAGKFRSTRRSPPQSDEHGHPSPVHSTCRARQPPSSRLVGPEEGWALITPRKIASELSFFGFNRDMEPYVMNLVFQTYTLIKPTAFGVRDLATTHLQDEQLFCFANLTQHPAILHSTIFAAQAFHDLAVGGSSYGTVAQTHLGKALRHLKKSLDDEREAMKFSTLAVVASLATAAIIARDLDTAVKHMDGLKRMVDLHGGLQVLGPGSMMEHKARAIDIGLAVGLGHDLRFGDKENDLSWSPQIALGRAAARFPEFADAFALHSRPDPRLLNVWADLREFSSLANEAAIHGIKVPIEITSRLTTSVPYRLLRLGREGGQTGALQELLRVGMLAFAKMLLVNLNGIGRKMRVLIEAVRGALTEWDLRVRREDAGGRSGVLKLLLWGVFVSGVSIFEDFEDEWLRGMLAHAISALGVRTWTETRVVLKEFLWIDAVFDQPAQLLFRRYCRGGVIRGGLA